MVRQQGGEGVRPVICITLSKAQNRITANTTMNIQPNTVFISGFDTTKVSTVAIRPKPST